MDIHTARGLRRLTGLAGRRGLPPGSALYVPRCRSIHTFGMRFPLDLVWLDGHGAIVRVDHSVPSCRVRSCGRARSVLELRAGPADELAARLAEHGLDMRGAAP